MSEIDNYEENKKKIIEYNKSEFIGRLIGTGGDPSKRLRPVNSAGVLEFGEDKIMFQTIFVPNGATYKPVVATSRWNTLEVKDMEEELIAEEMKRKDIKEEYKYCYFDYLGERFKLSSKPFFKDSIGINTVYIKNHFRHPDKSIYDAVIHIIKEYFDHFNIHEYDVMASFVIQTYIKDALGKTFYYVLQGSENTGKSTLQKIFARLQLNGLFMGKGTVAVTSRLIDCLGVNLNQDEFDKMGKEERVQFIAQANTGLYSDGTYTITDMNKREARDQIKVFRTFSSRSFSANSLHEFDRSFLSRSYILNTVRQGRSVSDINRVSLESERTFQNIRNALFFYCLGNWEKMIEDISSMKDKLQNEGSFGRRADMASIILGIVKHFKGDYYKEVETKIMEKEDIDREEDKDSYESIILEYLISIVCNRKEKNIIISNRDLHEHLIEELGLTYSSEKRPSPQTIGWTLKRLGLVARKGSLKRGQRGNRMYFISADDLLDRLRRFGYTELLRKHELSQSSSEPSVSSGSSKTNEQTEQKEEPEE